MVSASSTGGASSVKITLGLSQSSLTRNTVLNSLTTPTISRGVRAGGESDDQILAGSKDHTISLFIAWTTEMQVPILVNFIMHKNIKCCRDQFHGSMILSKGLAQILVTARMILVRLSKHLKHLQTARGD